MHKLPENIDRVNPREFHPAVRLLRGFFEWQGFTEMALQQRPSNLSVCENPFNIMTYSFHGQVWGLPQTNQMWLEEELLLDPSYLGCFCDTTSYRNEPKPKPGRHNLIFPMFEFEMHGDMDVLREKLTALLKHAGFGKEREFVFLSYTDALRYLGIDHGTEIEDEHEAKLAEMFGPVVFLEYFPEYTSPFWNMKREGDVAKKIDVLLHGVETIGSAERSTDTKEMRGRFFSISNGEYAKKMFGEFSEERVMKELDYFLSLNFFPRCGGGIGMNRWIRALKLEGLMPDLTE